MKDWEVNEPLTEEDFQSSDFFVDVFENYSIPPAGFEVKVKSLFNMRTLDGATVFRSDTQDRYIRDVPADWYLGVVIFDGLRFWQTFVMESSVSTAEMNELVAQKKKLQTKLRRLKKKHGNDASEYEADIDYQSLTDEIAVCKNRLNELKSESKKEDDVVSLRLLVPCNKLSDEYAQLFLYYQRLWDEDSVKDQINFLNKKNLHL